MYSSYYIIAPVGLCMFGAFVIFAATRLFGSYIAIPTEKPLLADEKVVVQLAFCIVGFVEVLNSISLWVEKGYSVWGFSLHMTGQFCTVIALISYMMMWAKFLSFGDDNNLLRAIYWTVVVLNGAVTILSISVALSSKDFNDLGDRYSIVLLLNFLVIALSMLLISGWMFLYGLRIYIRLRSTTSTTDRSVAISALRRVNIVLSVLVACAALRVFALVILMTDIIRHSHDQNDLGVLLWFIFSNWVPTLVPGCTLLYITRRGGVSSGSTQGSSLLQGTDSSFMKSSINTLNTPLTSEYTSSSGGAIMTTDSIYSSSKTQRTLSEDMELSMRMSSESHAIPGHKHSIYGRETEDHRDTSGSSGGTSAFFKHNV